MKARQALSDLKQSLLHLYDPREASVMAEWIVEDFESNGSLVPLSNFGTVVFTGATAGTSSGSSVGLSGATVIDLKQGNTVHTDVTINSASQVTIKYV